MRGGTTFKSEVIEFHCNNYFDRAAIVRAGQRSGLECGTGFLWILHNRLKEEIWFLRYFLGAVCDETQNLNETESETFFRYQFFSIPNPILFSIPIFFRNRYRYFYRYQKFSKPIPILFPRPIFFRNRYRYHQKTWKSFETESEAFQIKICGLDNVIVIMPRLIAFQPCSTLWVQYRQKEAKKKTLKPKFFETDTDTFSDTIFFFKTNTDTIKNIETFPNRI